MARILSRKKTLINFHEIWVGDYPGASWRESFLGWRQKKEVLKFLKILNPINIYTSNAAAIYRLRRQGINATYLYLYGNIPPSSKNEFVHDSEKINVIFLVHFTIHFHLTH